MDTTRETTRQVPSYHSDEKQNLDAVYRGQIRVGHSVMHHSRRGGGPNAAGSDTLEGRVEGTALSNGENERSTRCSNDERDSDHNEGNKENKSKGRASNSTINLIITILATKQRIRKRLDARSRNTRILQKWKNRIKRTGV